MSSIKRHLPHFGLNNHHHHRQKTPSSSSRSHNTDCLVPSSHNNGSHKGHHHFISSSTSMPSFNGGYSSSSTFGDSSTALPINNSIDTASFRQSIHDCLNVCSAYIQALNTVCSTGAVLAQSLTEVFSRDVTGVQVGGGSFGGTSEGNSESKSKKSFLGLKSNATNNVTGGYRESEQISVGSEFDYVYYDMTEQFLRTFETLSVATAGVTATLKTETLMSLQEVVNFLESSSPEEFDKSTNLEKSIQSAKACLLSYIELQSQFSYASWKSLNHLSKAMSMDSNMKDIVKTIKRHFETNSNTNVTTDSIHSQRTSFLPSTTTTRTISSHNETKETKLNDSDISKALEILSLNPSSKKSKSRRSLKQLNETFEKFEKSVENILGNTNTITSTTSNEIARTVGFLDDFANFAKNQTSTWPGKSSLTASTDEQQQSKSTAFKAKSTDCWSLWSSNAPTFSPSTVDSWFMSTATRPTANQPETAWDLFFSPNIHTSSSSDFSPPTGSTSSNNTSMGTLSSTSSYGGSSFAPFNHQLPTKTAISQPIYNNNDGEVARLSSNSAHSLFTTKNPFDPFSNLLDSNTLTNTTAMKKNSENNRNKTTSFTIIDHDFNATTTTGLMSPFNNSDKTTTNQSLHHSHFLSNVPLPTPASSSMLSNDINSFLHSSSSSVPSDVRNKTSTWPLKQPQQSQPSSTSSGASSGQNITNNWPLPISVVGFNKDSFNAWTSFDGLNPEIPISCHTNNRSFVQQSQPQVQNGPLSNRESAISHPHYSSFFNETSNNISDVVSNTCPPININF